MQAGGFAESALISCGSDHVLPSSFERGVGQAEIAIRQSDTRADYAAFFGQRRVQRNGLRQSRCCEVDGEQGSQEQWFHGSLPGIHQGVVG
jgi:hypothetical protein